MTIASKEAYASIVEKLPAKRAAVWDVVRSCPGGGVTIREAMVLTKWGHSTVSARLYELAEAGLIKANGEREGQTVWVPSDPSEVEQLREQRRLEREKRQKASSAPRVRAIVGARYVYLPSTVRGDHIFAGTYATPGVYKAHVNPHGAVSVTANDGKQLGVKPGEFVDVTVQWD